MSKQHHPTPKGNNLGRFWAGIIIVAIGAVLLAGRLNIDWLVPGWLISWPMMMIIIGLIIGGKSNFKNPAAFIMLGIGLFFLVQRITHFNMGPFLWPVIIIGIGLWLLLDKRSGRHPFRGSPNRYDRHSNDYEWDKRVPADRAGDNDQTFNDTAATGDAVQNKSDPVYGRSGYESENRANFVADDYVKSTAVFSEVKKTVISKNFTGGEVVNIFGGTDINLIQADIQTPVVIDIFQLFAGTKIIVPAHWKICSEVVSVFGEVDDRRFIQGIPQDEQKTVYIRGTSIFGGVTIKSI